MQSYKKSLFTGVRRSAMALLGMLFASSAALAQSSDKLTDELAVFIDTNMQVIMQASDIPAATVSVVKDGKLVYSKGFGVANIEQDTPVEAATSLFRIGSTSKLFTWTSVMQLYEQGLLDLDADVNTYLNNFQIPATYEEPITLKHILSHTAGFEEGGLGYLIKYDPSKALPLDEAMKTFLPRRINPPGVYSSYSNYATALAGLIVQNVSGMPFNDYVKQHILLPLGMHHTTFDEPLPAELAPHMTQGYTRKMGVFEAQPFEIISSFAPAGSVSSSADDMSKFMLAHLNDGELNGQRILKAETAQLMHSVLFQADERLDGMAYGFYEHTINGHRLIGHGGDTMQFHTDMLIDKSENLGIFMSIMNTVDNKARNGFVKSFYDYFFPQKVEPVTPPADFDQRAEQYAGEFQFLRSNESSIEKFVKVLSPAIQVVPTGKGTLFISGLYDARQYVEIGEHYFRQVDGHETVVFGQNADGEINALYFNSLPFMALTRAQGLETSFFKVTVPLICLLVFLQVVISWFYRRKDYQLASAQQRSLIYSNLSTALTNVVFVVFFSSILVAYQETLYEEIPAILGVSLILPIIASLLSLFSLYSLVKRWLAGEFSLGSKIYWSLVTAAGLFMTYFYFYWNLLGWNYY